MRKRKKKSQCFSVEASPLVQVRPSSRSKPSGHSQLKEPRVFTHLEPRGHGLLWHSSTSATFRKRQTRHKESLIYLGQAKELEKLTLATGGSRPKLLAVAGEPKALAADTHSTVHARVRSTGVSWRRRAASFKNWIICLKTSHQSRNASHKIIFFFI